MALDTEQKRKIKIILLLLFVFVGIGAFVGWYKFFREEPQPDWVTATPEMQFKYGSIGGENEAGIPYWIWYVLPRMFPEYLPGSGGYASLGIPWEQGQELPVGFTKKVIGFSRVGNNCAVCHTATYRRSLLETPNFVIAGPGHTIDVQGFFRFLTKSANDPRFNADNLLYEINSVTDLSWLDRLLYRFAIIPLTKKALVERGNQLEWMNRAGLPDWGHGRDDSLNLPKYFLAKIPEDGSFGVADFPSIWALNQYGGGKALSWDGSATSIRTFIVDSAVGVGARQSSHFEADMQWLADFLGKLPAPKYPFLINVQKVASGEVIFKAKCAGCHDGPHVATVIPIEEIRTDRNRLDTWTQQAADGTNRAVTVLGIKREGVIKTQGYKSPYLDGIWLRAPYLHNGSVPTMRDLLKPVGERPKLFYRGYDLYDPENMGFVSQGEPAMRVGSKIDVTQKGNGNQGHEYGTTLSSQDKELLMEYLKTL